MGKNFSPIIFADNSPVCAELETTSSNTWTFGSQTVSATIPPTTEHMMNTTSTVAVEKTAAAQTMAQDDDIVVTESMLTDTDECVITLPLPAISMQPSAATATSQRFRYNIRPKSVPVSKVVAGQLF